MREQERLGRVREPRRRIGAVDPDHVTREALRRLPQETRTGRGCQAGPTIVPGLASWPDRSGVAAGNPAFPAATQPRATLANRWLCAGSYREA